MFDRRKLWRGRGVVIPDIVMHGLEVPPIFSGARIEGQQRIGEQIVAGPIAAIKLVLCGGDRKIRDAGLFIDSNLSPYIDAAHVFVRVLRPRVVAELALMRNGVKHPDKLAGYDIKSADVPRRRQIALPRKASEDDEVFENSPRSSRCQRNRRAIDPDLQIELSMIRERVHGLSRQRLDRIKIPGRGDKDAAIAAIFALPVIGAALSTDSAPPSAS